MLCELRRLAPVVILATAALGCAAAGAETLALPMSGEARFDRDPCKDRAGRPGCVVNFEFNGEVARILYERMTSAAEVENCADGQVKWERSGLRCFMSADGTYACDASYNFVKQAFAAGDMSC